MLSRSHTTGWILPLLAALSPVALSRLRVSQVPAPVHALLAGTLVAVVSWAALRFVPYLAQPKAFPRGVLLGLLVAEGMVFSSGSRRVPAMSSIALLVFVYFFTTESAH